MNYRLDLLNHITFEDLINTICQDILGIGVIVFSQGKDGGRDGKFNGTAQNFPSKIEPWKGKFIIQAKHTSNPIASCSDTEFKGIVNKEIPKLINLKNSNNIDNYLLFTNRKYSGVMGEEILSKIKMETNIDRCIIIGIESINNQYINSNQGIIKKYRLNEHHIPFDFSDEEIKNIIIAFKTHLTSMKAEITEEVSKLKYDFKYIDKPTKNKKNNLTEEYFQTEIVSKSLMDFDKIEHFLNNPINSDLKDYYFDTAHELNQMITLNRNDFGSFEEIFIYIYKFICDGDQCLKGAKRHVTTFLHYMYYECLIGKK